MAGRALSEEVVRMNRLYNQYDTYAAVAKYVKLERMPKAAKQTFKKL